MTSIGKILNKNTEIQDNLVSYSNNIIENIDTDLSKTYYYKKIKEFIDDMLQSGVIFRSNGQCIAMSDLISKFLTKHGIKNKIVECSLSVFDGDKKNFHLVGVPNKNTNKPVDIDTHVICLTETEIPLLIDLSVGYINPSVPFIFRRVENQSENIISSFDLEGTTWTYFNKDIQLIPRLHQNSIIDRINTDKKIENEIKFLKIFLIIGVTISSLNLIRGSYDFYQKYVNQNNGFGPNKVIVDK